VLVYVSSLEEQAAIVADLGLSAAGLSRSLRCRTGEDVVAGIAALGALLHERCPGSPSDANELPDAPRIVP
jgi:uncharacterized membrane protein